MHISVGESTIVEYLVKRIQDRSSRSIVVIYTVKRENRRDRRVPGTTRRFRSRGRENSAYTAETPRGHLFYLSLAVSSAAPHHYPRHAAGWLVDEQRGFDSFSCSALCDRASSPRRNEVTIVKPRATSFSSNPLPLEKKPLKSRSVFYIDCKLMVNSLHIYLSYIYICM